MPQSGIQIGHLSKGGYISFSIGTTVKCTLSSASLDSDTIHNCVLLIKSFPTIPNMIYLQLFEPNPSIGLILCPVFSPYAVVFVL